MPFFVSLYSYFSPCLPLFTFSSLIFSLLSLPFNCFPCILLASSCSFSFLYSPYLILALLAFQLLSLYSPCLLLVLFLFPYSPCLFSLFSLLYCLPHVLLFFSLYSPCSLCIVLVLIVFPLFTLSLPFPCCPCLRLFL